ncbi:oligogalacturonate-specific porin KdgM family protein [Psychromonas sp. MME2]|uniref:oligogalacturonate-specific porin KdgM family protein n=1 Tax=unclassified Psychromonas TaxID=2614957 RepID=UPI00339BC9F7
MKKFNLSIAISTILCSSLAFAEGEAEAEVPYTPQGTTSSYITGNVQNHSRQDFNGSDVTSTIEAGHTFATGTTVYVEFDGIQLGKTDEEGDDSYYSNSAYTTIGVDQAFDITESLWIGGGYQHLLHNGDTIQYRPYAKIGYNFNDGMLKGVSISNRTRYQIADGSNKVGDQDNTNDQLRFDNRIAYQFQEMPVQVAYNNVYYINEADNKSNTFEHEVRATWTREGVQPYLEYRNQADAADVNPGANNNVIVLGASYAF